MHRDRTRHRGFMTYLIPCTSSLCSTPSTIPLQSRLLPLPSYSPRPPSCLNTSRRQDVEGEYEWTRPGRRADMSGEPNAHYRCDMFQFSLFIPSTFSISNCNGKYFIPTLVCFTLLNPLLLHTLIDLDRSESVMPISLVWRRVSLWPWRQIHLYCVQCCFVRSSRTFYRITRTRFQKKKSS